MTAKDKYYYQLQIIDEIKRIDAFTEWWIQQLHDWEKDPQKVLDTPNYGKIVKSIIANRQSYVRKLKKLLETL